MGSVSRGGGDECFDQPLKALHDGGGECYRGVVVQTEDFGHFGDTDKGGLVGQHMGTVGAVVSQCSCQ